MEEAVLLRELRAEGARDLDAARLHLLEHGAQVRHGALAREACAGALLEVRIGGRERPTSHA